MGIFFFPLCSQKKLCSFSARLKKMVKQEKKRRSSKGSITEITIMDFPGGPIGFELISRFCYNNGRISMGPSNVSILHSSAILLEMTEETSSSNLLAQSETFLDGLFYWTWDDIIISLKTCEPFFSIADSSGLLLKLISSLIAKISENTDSSLTEATPFPYSPSPSSSPDILSISLPKVLNKEWWFDDLSILAPSIIEKVLKTLGAYGAENKNLTLTKFLLHYLKKVGVYGYKGECGNLAETAVNGVVLMGRAAFSCRGLFWVLRIVSGFRLSKECRLKLERVIGLLMDQATLDDLLVSGRGDEGVYDVSLVMRLARVFVSGVEDGGVPLQRLKKVGRLVDKYLGEISPDQSLKVSKFLGVAESLPDSARDCFDGVYRALDIYLQVVGNYHESIFFNHIFYYLV